MRGLYAIVDADALGRAGLEPAEFAEAVLDAKPVTLQWRDKRQGSREALTVLRALRPLASRAGVPLFANDRPDLALLARCDGVHVGQDDLPVPSVRELAPGLRVGVSTHDRAQALSCLSDEPDYIAIGPVYATTSKDRPSPVLGLDGLDAIARAIRAERTSPPVVAIGGIGLETISAVAGVCSCVAVIGALLPSAGRSKTEALAETNARARSLVRAIDQASKAPMGATA